MRCVCIASLWFSTKPKFIASKFGPKSVRNHVACHFYSLVFHRGTSKSRMFTFVCFILNYVGLTFNPLLFTKNTFKFNNRQPYVVWWWNKHNFVWVEPFTCCRQENTCITISIRFDFSIFSLKNSSLFRVKVLSQLLFTRELHMQTTVKSLKSNCVKFSLFSVKLMKLVTHLLSWNFAESLWNELTFGPHCFFQTDLMVFVRSLAKLSVGYPRALY